MSVGRRFLATCCNTYIQSVHVHDFVTCECGKVSVDGGGEYLRVVGDISLLKPPPFDDQKKPL